MTPKRQGLWIANTRIGRSVKDFLDVVKYAVVPETLWAEPAFASNDPEEVITLADSLALEIVSAMIDDTVEHHFVDSVSLANNVALRMGVIAAMHDICAGHIDADYVEDVIGVPPTLGYSDTLEVLWAPGAKTGQGVLTTPLPYAPPDAGWDHIDTGSPWIGPAFVQKDGVPLSKAIQMIHPFRGECAGALELAVMSGCQSRLGGDALDQLSEKCGPALVGIWRLNDEISGKPVDTLALRFLSQLHKLPEDYQRGSVIAVPGDYLYFKNKDDYPTLAKDGGWRGENCIYMGQDALGDPHYSGMGLAWKTEFALRMFLENAYFKDCNATYLAARRAGKTPKSPPVIVEDPMAQVRFTARGVMRYPDPAEIEPVRLTLPVEVPAPLSDAELRKRLVELGAKPQSTTKYRLNAVRLGALIDDLKFPQGALRQGVSAGANESLLHVTIGDWFLSITPCDVKVLHPALDDAVDVVAQLSEGTNVKSS